jgi:uncharacterized protein YndB with AHSA1/START domain
VATNEITIDAPPAAVWGVLAEPDRYDEWVIGTKEVRDADDSWPAVGARLLHRTGVGPLTVEDETTVEESVPPTRLVLLAKVGAIGSFRVTIDVRGEGTRTIVQLAEQPVRGIAAHVPGTDRAIEARNTVSLERLKQLAEATPATSR